MMSDDWMKDDCDILPDRIWLVAAGVSFALSLPVAIYGERAPWLIALPITVGGTLIALFKLISEKESLLKLIAQDDDFGDPKRALELQKQIIHTWQVSTVDKGAWPKQPDVLIDPPDSLETNITSILAKDHRLVLTGERGSGKTTCAISLCRKYERLNGSSPIKRIPIFISLSQMTRSEGLASMFLDCVAQQLELNDATNRRSSIKKMMSDGSLFLVLDDLDYMAGNDEQELQKFIKQWRKNAFLCIISEVLPNSFFSRDFARMEMPEWPPETVRLYIDRRIPDTDKKARFVGSLEQSHLLQQQMAPWQASFLVDACLDGTFYKLLTLGPTTKAATAEMDNKILDDYLSIVMADSDRAKYLERIREFGKLAMNLLKEGRSTFVPDEEQIKEEHLVPLMPKLFQEYGRKVGFSHGNYQIFLAGRYIAEFWQEAKSALQDTGARALVWKPVYNCARQFFKQGQIKEIDETFRRLAS